MSAQPKVLIVVPTYNEEENIQPLLASIFASRDDVHILFVDDNSQDRTRELIAEAQTQYSGKIDILKRAGKLGLGTAYIEGFKWGLGQGFEIIIEMDADLSHNPAYLNAMIDGLEKSDAVVGSRWVKGGGTKYWSLLRIIISRLGSLYARIVLGLNLSDLTGGFNFWKAEVLQNIDLNSIKSEGYAFQIELKYRASKNGYHIKEMPIVFVDRRAGHSKMSYKIVLEAIYKVALLRFAGQKEIVKKKALT